MLGMLSLSDTGLFNYISEEEEEAAGVRSPVYAGQWRCRAVCIQLGLPLPPSEEIEFEFEAMHCLEKGTKQPH